MNIQIFGRSKCFDTKKAQRWFKERRIKFQYIDIDRYGMSRGELQNVCSAVGGIQSLINEKAPGIEELTYLAFEADKFEKMLECPEFIKTPVVRNGKKATVGCCPEVWETWE